MEISRWDVGCANFDEKPFQILNCQTMMIDLKSQKVGPAALYKYTEIFFFIKANPEIELETSRW